MVLTHVSIPPHPHPLKIDRQIHHPLFPTTPLNNSPGQELLDGHDLIEADVPDPEGLDALQEADEGGAHAGGLVVEEGRRQGEGLLEHWGGVLVVRGGRERVCV